MTHSDDRVFQRLLRQFLAFAGISGACWVLDFVLLLVLTLGFGMSALAGNLVSSSIAAGTAFTISARYVFKRGSGVLAGKLAFYLIYNALMIIAASWVMGQLVPWLMAWMGRPHAVVLAKVLVTPVLMLSNFAVGKLTAERLRI
ncbi:GtrA family protein [Paracidovorax citrulli]